MPLLHHALRRELAQLVVHQRQQPAGRVRVALLEGSQQRGDIGHQPQIIPVGRRARQQADAEKVSPSHGRRGDVLQHSLAQVESGPLSSVCPPAVSEPFVT